MRLPVLTLLHIAAASLGESIAAPAQAGKVASGLRHI
jgi:hypothetical protein